VNLAGRTAVVTGAGSGIGRAIAVSLAKRHCHLALADIDEAGLSQTAKFVENFAVNLSLHLLDVGDQDAVATLPKAVAQRHAKVDLLFNNAGVALGGSFEEVSEADFQWLFNINFWGVVRMSRAFLPVLRQSDAARIVNISSLFGLISPPGQAAYAASKFAVRGFSNALRYELEGSTVAVTVVHPGGVATSIARNARKSNGNSAAQIDEAIDRVEQERVIIVADDSISVRKFVGRMLEKNGYRVKLAADGLEAAELVAQHGCHLVITDLEMPRMTGYELMVQLRQSPTTRRIPVMVVTSRAGAKHRDRAIKEGAAAFLTKPVQEDQLIAAVEQLLGTEATRPLVPVA